MDRPPSGPRRRLVAALLPETSLLAASGVFAHVGSGVPLVMVLPILGTTFVLAVVAQYLLTYEPLVATRERELSTFLTEYLSMAERQLEAVAADEASLRASVVRLESDGAVEILGREFLRTFGDESLRVAYVADEADYRSGELDLAFDVGQGCCGRVVAENDQFVSVSPSHTAGWDSAWGTTPLQDRATRHLNVIVGTPIYRPSDDRKEHPVGVFVVDSEDDLRDLFDVDEGTALPDVDFKDTALAREAIQHAKNIGILL